MPGGSRSATLGKCDKLRIEIIIAIIGAVPALITAIVSVVLNNRVVNVKLDNLEKRFDHLEAKVDAHNNFNARIAKLEAIVDNK